MRLPFRFLFVVFSLLVIFLTGMVVALAFEWAIPLQYLVAFFAEPSNRWGLMVVCVFIIIMALQIMVVALKTHREIGVIVQETGLGKVEISAPALENLIRRAVRQVREVRDIKPVLRYMREGLAVLLHVHVMPDSRLPEVSQEVQKLVQEYLEDKVGIKVLQVEVRIDSVSSESRLRVE